MTANKEFFKDGLKQENPVFAFPTGPCSNQPAQLQILARMLKLCMKQVKISYFVEAPVRLVCAFVAL